MSEYLSEYPVKALNYFKVSNSLTQRIFFYYNDPSLNYSSFINNDLIADVLIDIKENMQYFVDQDKLFINNKEVGLQIVENNVQFDRNNLKKPILYFKIKNEDDFLLEKENTIILESEEEELEYPINSFWTLPGKITSVKSAFQYSIEYNKIHFWAKRGQIVAGYERIDFFD